MPLASAPGAPLKGFKEFDNERKLRVIKGVCQHIDTQAAYGMAGGGMGVYEYCTDCYEVLSKTQDVGE